MRTLALFLLSTSLPAQLINTPREIETINLGETETLRSFLTDSSGNHYFIGNTLSSSFTTSPYAFRTDNPAARLVRSKDQGRTWQPLNQLPDSLTLFTPASDGLTSKAKTVSGMMDNLIRHTVFQHNSTQAKLTNCSSSASAFLFHRLTNSSLPSGKSL